MTPESPGVGSDLGDALPACRASLAFQSQPQRWADLLGGGVLCCVYGTKKEKGNSLCLKWVLKARRPARPKSPSSNTGCRSSKPGEGYLSVKHIHGDNNLRDVALCLGRAKFRRFSSTTAGCDITKTPDCSETQRERPSLTAAGLAQ